ncbi:MAG: nitrous oxide reductase accessory protein NosL [Rhizobiaceae bacterium]
MRRLVIATCTVLALTACQDQQSVSIPQAAAMTDDALGHYCQMNLADHEGPKAQIHLVRFEQPIWFSQVRDAIAFTRLPEETEEWSVVYVSDMGEAPNWAEPGIDNWIDAKAAWFVIGSGLRGGMGAPEAIPFGDERKALAFAGRNGGDVVRLVDIPDDYVLAPVDISPVIEPERTGDQDAVGLRDQDVGDIGHGGHVIQ